MVRNLRQGDRGDDVRAVQDALNNLGTVNPPLGDAGNFDARTTEAVIAFQRQNGLQPDGIVGPETRTKLFPLATVTIRLAGMRLRLPEFGQMRQPLRPNLLPGQLRLGGSEPRPMIPPSLSLPRLLPIGPPYPPQSFPLLGTPIAAPAPVTPTFLAPTLPVHHFEISPGGTVSLFDSSNTFAPDFAFGLTISGVVMIGDENATHNEFSSGLAMSTPGALHGGDWSVSWFAQITHVHQLFRAGNFSWQPNAQVSAGQSGSMSPVLGLSAAPFNVSFDLNNSLSINLGGPSGTATLDPLHWTLSWSLASFGLVGKFN